MADLHPIWWTHFLNDLAAMPRYALQLIIQIGPRKEHLLSRGDNQFGVDTRPRAPYDSQSLLRGLKR